MSNEMQNLGSLLPTLYKDSAQPTFRVAGEALRQVASLVLNPVGRCAEIAEKNAIRFLNKFDADEKDIIVPPETGVAVPILQKLSYTEEDELVELYCELLKNACLKNNKSKVLPSYTNIISSLTPDEANMLSFFFNENYLINLSLHLIKKHNLRTTVSDTVTKHLNSDHEVPVPFPQLPFLEVRSQESNERSWIVLIKYFTDISNRVALQNPENVELYIDNLGALGVINIKNDVFMVPTEIYKHLEEKQIIINLKNAIELKKRKIALMRGRIAFTNLGNSFLESCTKKQQAPTSNHQ